MKREMEGRRRKEKEEYRRDEMGWKHELGGDNSG
jgi:hypothetical protein